MTQLDRHVRHVQNKLTLSRFLAALAATLLVAALAAWVVVIVQRTVNLALPRPMWWLAGVVGAATIMAGVIALIRRPTPHQAAIAIDENLSLKEKFSTALFARGSTDPFARAAVADAERQATSVQLAKRFPVGYPRRATAVMAVALAAVLTAWLLPSFDLLGIRAAHDRRVQQAAVQRSVAIANAKDAIVQLESAPKGVADADAVQLARQDLQRLLQHPPADGTQIQRKVDSALQQMQNAKSRIEAQQKFAEAQEQLHALHDGLVPPTDKGPVADAHRALADGEIDQAMQLLSQAVDDFAKMPPQQQQQAAKQMANLAQQIQQQAQNPATQKNIQQQLQKMGANQQQAQQMSKLMQQAAQGNPSAVQQLQQMANQLAQQANAQHPGQSQQQQQAAAQAIQQAMQKMQQQANGQAQAQQLSQSAQQLAQAMQQVAQQGQQQGQQASQQPGQKPGQQPGQNAGGNQGKQSQQMAQATQQMKQALQQLQGMANGAQAAQAMQNGQNQGNNPNQNTGLAQANQITESHAGDERAGLMSRPVSDPLAHKTDTDLAPTDTDPNGRLLASSFVKDDAPIKGDSKQGLAHVAEAEQQNTTDEVDEDRIPRSAQNAVKKYFQTLQQDGQ